MAETREAQDPRRRRQYDRFGPWALKVEGPEDLPPCFDPWREEVLATTLALKLPRLAERRELKPEDDLYEGVLALGTSQVLYLALLGKGNIQRRAIDLGQIAALRLERELLLGRIGFDLVDGGSLEVVFGTVSAPVLEEFLGLVLERLSSRAGEGAFPIPRAVREPGEDDSLFRALLGELRKAEPGLTLLAYQGPCQLRPPPGLGLGDAKALLARLHPWFLDSCLVGQGSRGLVAIQESRAPRMRRNKGYRYETLYLPKGRLIGAGSRARTLALGTVVHALALSVEGHRYEFFFREDPCL